MLRHFVRVTDLERAVIEDNMADVRKIAAGLTRPRAKDPASWGPYVGYFRRAAQSVAAAKDMTQAAIGTATVVAQCGRCHAAFDVRLSSTNAGDPPPNATVAGKMRRHRWTTGLMRNAIVFSSNELWLRGAKALLTSPLDASEVGGSEPLKPQVAVHVRHLRELAKIAIAAPRAERVGTYGAILRTCVNCHIKTR